MYVRFMSIWCVVVRESCRAASRMFVCASLMSRHNLPFAVYVIAHITRIRRLSFGRFEIPAKSLAVKDTYYHGTMMIDTILLRTNIILQAPEPLTSL